MAVVSIFAISVAAILALVLLVVSVIVLSTAGGRRAAGHVLIHAAWILPVLAILGAGLFWVNIERASLTPEAAAASIENGTTQIATSEHDPSRSIFETPESRLVNVTTAHTVQFRPIGIISLAVIGMVLFVALGARRMFSKHVGAAITVVSILGVLVTLAAGAVALYLNTTRLVIMDHQEQMDAAIETNAILNASARSQVLDYRGQPESGVNGESPAIPEDGSSEIDGPTTEIIAYRGSNPVGEQLTAMPDWIGEEGVITSELWATTEEAERELLSQARSELRNYLAIEYPQAATWTPSAGHVTSSGAIVRRCHEIVPMEFNGFTEPMYRVSWQLDLTPAVRRSLFEAWRPLIVQQRILWLAVGVGVLSLVLGTVGTYFRVDRATDGAYRGRLKIAVAAMCVAACLVPLLLA